MFSQILFLITVLLLISFTPQTTDNPWVQSPSSAFIYGLVTYAFTISLIILLNRLFSQQIRKSKNLFLGVANFFIIACLIIYLFVLTGQRVFPNSSFLISLFSLVLYYAAIFIFHFSAYPSISPGTRNFVNSASAYASNQIRFLLPFCIPFLIFSLIVDCATLIPSTPLKDWILMHHDSPIGTATVLGVLILFLLLILLFFPPLTIKIWKCKNLPSSDLTQQLESLCEKAKFKHAGMKTWTILNHTYTAAIVGVLPRFRYVMFTKRLLSHLSPQSIIAVLAHEIGHSARKHLLIYPSIIIGMVVCTGLFSTLFGPSFDEWFMMHDRLYPSPVWQAVYPFALFIPYTLIFLLYFRLIFGYFSRLFERQADLHVYELELPAKDMQLALDELGHITGGTHTVPCWHHYSIQQRIDFLEETKNDPRKVENHHRRVRFSLIGYYFLLALGLYVMFSSSEEIGETISDHINKSYHEAFTNQIIEQYHLSDRDPLVHNALYNSVKKWAIYAPKSIVPFVAANTLYRQGAFSQSAALMQSAWKNPENEKRTPELVREFSLLTEQILRELSGNDKEQLEKVYRHALSFP